MNLPAHLEQKIINGAVGVLPTDTIFGIAASVYNSGSLERIYLTKGRDFNKKLIHLISDVNQLKNLGININDSQKETLSSVWPGPVSIEFVCDDTVPYLHKNTYKIAVRLPDKKWLRDLIDKTGPIVATSANISGSPTPSTIFEIKRQLPGLDFYVDGPVGTEPSRLARLDTNGVIEWLARN